jgi:HAD superfamily hydrolase (TIGR01509 family)
MPKLEAVIFDQDGVIADTERDGHRVAFNRAFAEFGLQLEWDVHTYGELLKVGGGKERMRHYLVREGLDSRIGDVEQLVKEVHKRKTDLFTEIIQKGQLELRPGVARLVKEVHEAGLAMAVCSTSNERAVNTLVRALLGDDAYGWFDIILAGDVVKEKKPNPEIYNMAKTRLGLAAESCVVIEDNRNGLLAAKGAGMKCIITVNAYTQNEDYDEADLVVSSLGDPEGDKAEILAGKTDIPFAGWVTVDLIRGIVE